MALGRLLLWNLLLSSSLRNPIPVDEPSWSSEIEKVRRLVCLRKLGPSLAYGSSGWDCARPARSSATPFLHGVLSAAFLRRRRRLYRRARGPHLQARGRVDPVVVSSCGGVRRWTVGDRRRRSRGSGCRRLRLGRVAASASREAGIEFTSAGIASRCRMRFARHTIVEV